MKSIRVKANYPNTKDDQGCILPCSGRWGREVENSLRIKRMINDGLLTIVETVAKATNKKEEVQDGCEY